MSLREAAKSFDKIARSSRPSFFQKEDLSFNTMNPYIYYGVTFFMYGICFCGGLFVNDLGLIFELISAFVLSFLNFIWPGAFYIFAERRYGMTEKGDNSTKINIYHSYIEIFLGVCVFAIMMVKQFL